MAYHNIKSHKKQGFTFSLENTFLGKPQGGKTDPPSLLRVKLSIYSTNLFNGIFLFWLSECYDFYDFLFQK